MNEGMERASSGFRDVFSGFKMSFRGGKERNLAIEIKGEVGLELGDIYVGEKQGKRTNENPLHAIRKPSGELNFYSGV